MKKIWGVECPECKKRLFSFHVHDFKSCGCPNETFVDGGTCYLRAGFKTKKPRRIAWSKQDGNYEEHAAPYAKRKDWFPY